MPNEPVMRYASLQARRGREAYIQLRVAVNALRGRGVEPKAIWVSTQTAKDMRALWYEVTLDPLTKLSLFDGKLPSIMGVVVREGATGGDDYVIQYHDSAVESDAARQVVDRLYKVQDNPLDGTH